MFTKEEVKSLEQVFTLARQQAATAHGDNFHLMEGLITVQKNIMNKVVSMVTVENEPEKEEGTEEQTETVEAEKVEEQPAMHNVD